MKVAIIGTAGIPANYGGFETLAQNLAEFHNKHLKDVKIVVYCSEKNYKEKPSRYLKTELQYIKCSANGAWSIIYDMYSIFKAILHKCDTLLILGVSGAIILPVLRRTSKARIITNIDGIEWRREKWHGLARWFLRFSERIAVQYSDEVIADNDAIATYIWNMYGISPKVIAYGGDHALQCEPIKSDQILLPTDYALTICRIEPENNIHLILDAFTRESMQPIVLIGNWNNSSYGRNLYSTYKQHKNLFLLEPIYDQGILKYIRNNARLYVHGHSAGGTNPSLVEAMHFGKSILAYDCEFNRYTTENRALFFKNAEELTNLITSFNSLLHKKIGLAMLEIAQRRYTWNVVAREYFKILLRIQ